MLDIFRSLRSFVKISRVHTDGNIFRLHYALTVIILMLFCIIVTTKTYSGDPIECITSHGHDRNFINTLCWTDSTFSVKTTYESVVGSQVPYPGIGTETDWKQYQFHRYYQWVCFVLFFQAAAFYTPRYLWKLWESGKVEAVVMHLDVGVGFEPDLTLKKQAIVDYLYYSSGHHDWYAARYYFCEILSFLNVIAQMFILDKFFEGRFLRYGLDVFEYLSQQQMQRQQLQLQQQQQLLAPLNQDPFQQIGQQLPTRSDPMTRIFPHVAKCKVNRTGPAATVELIDALCLLPLNVINEKIYLFLWFWFVFLAIVTFLMLIFGLVIMACPSVRVNLLNMRFKMSQLNQLDIIVRKSTIGDWFLLYLIGKNMDSFIMKDVLSELAQRYMTKGKEFDQSMAI